MSLEQQLISVFSQAAREDLSECPGDREVDRVLGPTELIQAFEEIEARYGIQIDRSDSRLHGGFGDLIRNLKSQIESRPPVQQAELEKPSKVSAKRKITQPKPTMRRNPESLPASPGADPRRTDKASNGLKKLRFLDTLWAVLVWEPVLLSSSAWFCYSHWRSTLWSGCSSCWANGWAGHSKCYWRYSRRCSRADPAFVAGDMGASASKPVRVIRGEEREFETSYPPTGAPILNSPRTVIAGTTVATAAAFPTPSMGAAMN